MFLIVNIIDLLNSDIKKYKKEPKTEEEIRNNFNNLKPEFSDIGIHLDEELINSIINCNKNTATNLIYKIKTKMTRKNINFDEIMNKIKISYKKLEDMKNLNKKFMKSSMNFFKRESKLLVKSKSSSNFSEVSGFTDYRIPLKINSQATSLISSSKENRLLSKQDSKRKDSNQKEYINAFNKNIKIKLKPLENNRNKQFIFPKNKEEMKNNYNKNINRSNIIPKKSKNVKEITEEFSQNYNYTGSFFDKNSIGKIIRN